MYIKYGKDVRTFEDARNLVTSMILRQKRDFDKASVTVQVCRYMSGSPLDITPRQLDRLISDSLDVCCRNHIIKCRTGIYRTRIAASF